MCAPLSMSVKFQVLRFIRFRRFWAPKRGRRLRNGDPSEFIDLYKNHPQIRFQRLRLTVTMLFTVEELSPWLGVTRFELLVQTIGLLLFSIIFTIKLEANDPVSIGNLSSKDIWWIFSPLFAANVINAYFCVIVFIRTCLERTFKVAVVRAIWSGTVIFILMVFEYMLCQKLIGGSSLDTSEIVSPILLLLQLLAVRACQTQ